MVVGPAGAVGDVGPQASQRETDVVKKSVNVGDFLLNVAAEVPRVQLDDWTIVNDDTVTEDREIQCGAEGETGWGGCEIRSRRRGGNDAPVGHELDATDAGEEPSEEAG